MGWRFFPSPKPPHRFWGPPILLYIGYLPSRSGVKLSGREFSHWFPPSAEVKEEWSYKPTPQVCHHGVNRDTLPYTFSLCVCTVQFYVIIQFFFIYQKSGYIFILWANVVTKGELCSPQCGGGRSCPVVWPRLSRVDQMVVSVLVYCAY